MRKGAQLEIDFCHKGEYCLARDFNSLKFCPYCGKHQCIIDSIIYDLGEFYHHYNTICPLCEDKWTWSQGSWHRVGR